MIRPHSRPSQGLPFPGPERVSPACAAHRHALAVRRALGFTLIELLVVISIIALLVIALQPAISSALGASENAATKARMLELAHGAKSFEEEWGVFPPDDFSDLAKLGVTAKADAINTGIESYLLFVSWQHNGGTDFTQHEDWLDNTDGDDNGTMIPLLERTAKMEIVDGWGTPIAYFVNHNYGKPQTIRTRAGNDLVVRARKNPNSTGYLAPRGYQFLSAGPDLQFGTDDDLTHPELPIE